MLYRVGGMGIEIPEPLEVTPYSHWPEYSERCLLLAITLRCKVAINWQMLEDSKYDFRMIIDHKTPLEKIRNAWKEHHEKVNNQDSAK